MLQQVLARAGLIRTPRNSPGDSDELGDEFKLPKMASLAIMIAYNAMLQVCNAPY